MDADLYARAWPVVRFDTIDSTNEEARRRALAGDTGPAWLTAARQTAGRGRQGRSWSSPEGNLYATALFRFDGGPAQASLVCFLAGLAVIDAVRALGIDDRALRLKWPNDVLLSEAKLAGVLIETGQTPEGMFMAAGFGVNIASAPPQPDRPTACLGDLSALGLRPADVLGRLDAAFRGRLSQFARHGFAPQREAWLRRAAHIGHRVRARGANGPLEGVMTGLAEDGALLLQLDGGDIHPVRAGEISLLGE